MLTQKLVSFYKLRFIHKSVSIHIKQMIENLQSELRKHLDSDESLLWTGKPAQGVKLKGSDAFMIPFSIMWGGFAIFWESTVVFTDAPFFFKLWGIPFVLVGLYLIVGRFFYDAKRREKTIYGLTENRIIIKSGVFKETIKSLNIKTLSDITLNEKSNKSGTIVLGSENGFTGMLRGTGWPGANGKMAPAIEMIDNVRAVYRKITELQK